MKKLAILIAIVLSIYSYISQTPNSTSSKAVVSADNLLISAIENQESDSQVSGSGIVLRTLADDTKGSRHQKFIIQLSSNRTLLVAHNIDLAPRINSLRKGDKVEFYGEYEWNPQGGVIHWTHHDPKGKHIDGWLKHEGRTYQ